MSSVLRSRLTHDQNRLCRPQSHLWFNHLPSSWLIADRDPPFHRMGTLGSTSPITLCRWKWRFRTALIVTDGCLLPFQGKYPGKLKPTCKTCMVGICRVLSCSLDWRVNRQLKGWRFSRYGGNVVISCCVGMISDNYLSCLKVVGPSMIVFKWSVKERSWVARIGDWVH